MDDKVKIVTVDNDEVSRRDLAFMLKSDSGIDLAAEIGQFKTAYSVIKKSRPQIVILNLSPSEDEALQLADRISATLPGTILFVTSTDSKPESIIRAMRAGAREFFTLPLKRDQVINAVNSVARHTQADGQAAGNSSRIYTIFGAKGGIGSTTVATNLAITLKQQSGKNVILVDLNKKPGNLALFLNLEPKYTIVDIVNHLSEIDTKMLKNHLPVHSSGVHLLAAPPQIEKAESVQGTHIEQILALLREIFEFIILDVDFSFNDVTISALDESDTILTLSSLDVPGIYNTKRCLDLFKKMGYDEDKVRLVVNRYSPNNGSDVNVLERLLNYSVFWRIPNISYSHVIASINQGRPISQMMPRSDLTANLNELTNKLISENGSVPHFNPKNRLESAFQKLFTLTAMMQNGTAKTVKS